MRYTIPERTSQPGPSETTMALIAYVLHLVGAVLGLPSLIALVINYMTRRDDEWVSNSHHTWMIRTFWWAVLWSVIGALTWIFFIGMAILGLTWLWYLYRHIRGLFCLLNNRPMPA